MIKNKLYNKFLPKEKKNLGAMAGNVQIDSRKVMKNDVFIAIRSGNGYINDVLNKGASLVFYDDFKLEIQDERAIYVEDSTLFLQILAKEYRSILDVIVIGITGSEGKTSTKDILYSIISSKYKGKKTQGNFNNHIGLPLTLLQLEEDDKFIALEMGMSDLGEIEILSDIAKPDYAIITNIGDSHLEFLKNRDNVFKAKTEIFKFVKPENRIVYGDDEYFKKIDAIRIGENFDNDYIISDFFQDINGSSFTFSEGADNLSIKTNLYGKYNAFNIALSTTMAKKIGVSDTMILKQLKELQLSGMRFERVELNNKVFINDSYNASPVSMEVSLKTFNEIFKDEYKVVILGDMLELGENSKKFHEDLSYLINRLEIEEIYLVGKNMKNLYKVLEHPKCIHCEDVGDVKKKIKNIQDGAVILLKGSNGINLNKILTEEM